ncbi:MAG TPA: hypothetical protein VGE29_16520 [Prosthecobacter sp.]
MNMGICLSGILLSTLLILPAAPLPAQTGERIMGVVVYEGQVQQAAHEMEAVAYMNTESFPVTMTLTLENRRKIRLARGSIATVADFTDVLSCNLMSARDFDFLQSQEDFFEEIASRHPKAAPLLKGILAEINSFQEKVELGQVRISGRWTTKAEHEARIQARKEAEEAMSEAAHQRYLAKMEKQRQEMQEAQDAEQREKNLQLQVGNPSGQILLKRFQEMKELLEAHELTSLWGEPLAGGYQALPQPLPPVAGFETTLYTANSSSGIAFLAIQDGSEVKALRFAVPLLGNGENVTNTDVAQAFQTHIASVSQQAGSWLPLAVASARTQLKSRPTLKESVIRGTLDQRSCELILTTPELQESGSFRSHLIFTLH